MESVLLWWSLEWNWMHKPVYTTYMKTEHQCMAFADAFRAKFFGEFLVVFEDETKTCRMVIFNGENIVPR